MTKKQSSVHPVDRHVGVKLRQKRILSGMSQEEVGKALKLTFQQIQKYETGLNRISCSTLYEISNHLKVDVSYFFEGLKNNNENSLHLSMSEAEDHQIDLDLAEKKDIRQLIKIFCNIDDQKVRKKIFSLIKLFSDNRLIM